MFRGGLLIADDYDIAQPVKVSIDRFVQRYQNEIEGHKNIRGQYWIYKKKEKIDTFSDQLILSK